MAEKEKHGVTSEFATKAVTKAWSDPAYKARLLKDPRGALAEVGVTVPDNVNLKVLEDTGTLMHLVLPAAPSGELSEEALAKVAGGGRTPLW
jgi:hypothetical protein